MRRRVTGGAVLSVGLAGAVAGIAAATDLLEIDIVRFDASGTILHEIYFEANRDGATTCDLVTPLGTYVCTDVGGRFRAEPAFFDEHVDLTFAEVQSIVSSPWTVTWDAGAGQTVATLELGPITIEDVPAIPSLTAPVDGEVIEVPADPNPPVVTWMYDGISDPCEAQPDHVVVIFTDQESIWDATTVIDSGELACTETSWEPSEALPEGIWFTAVVNALSFRDVPDGITVVEGDWPLENTDWLQLYGADRVHNEVIPVERSSWSEIKARHRDPR